MPIFEFRCADCGREFDALCRSADMRKVECPACGGTHLARLISSFAVSRRLTPCGTPASDAPRRCGPSVSDEGCAACCRRA